jgi:hypothetical protein
MKRFSVVSLVLLACGTGCLQPGNETRFAETEPLANSIQFTQLTVSGNSVRFQIARSNSNLPTARAGAAGPVDFPEVLTFEKDSSGFLTVVPSQTHTGLNVSDAQCTDGDCTAIQMKLARPNASADFVVIKANRLPSVECGISLIAPNGATTDFTPDPTFTDATVTVILELNPKTQLYEQVGHLGFYGQTTFPSPSTGYLTNLYVRSFVSEPADLWIDQIDSVVQTDGRVTRVATTNRNYAVNQVSPSATIFDIYGSDPVTGSAQIACTSSTPITTPPLPPRKP